jgi:hypothetical protein
MTNYKPTTFNGEPLTTTKMNQLANNVQYLFERSANVRYASSGITRDNGIKVITGKTAFAKTSKTYTNVYIYFGSYFTAGCSPTVQVSLELPNLGHRYHISFRGFNGGGQVDHRGMIAVVATEAYKNLPEGGFVHWTATGY